MTLSVPGFVSLCRIQYLNQGVIIPIFLSYWGPPVYNGEAVATQFYCTHLQVVEPLWRSCFCKVGWAERLWPSVLPNRVDHLLCWKLSPIRQPLSMEALPRSDEPALPVTNALTAKESVLKKNQVFLLDSVHLPSGLVSYPNWDKWTPRQPTSDISLMKVTVWLLPIPIDCKHLMGSTWC